MLEVQGDYCHFVTAENGSAATDGVCFSAALAKLKEGHRVARAGWNGKGMYLYLVPSNRYPPTILSEVMLAAGQPDGLVPYAAYIAMKPASGGIVPWLASQTDVLSDDWIVLD